jgi:hypothetical protein
MPNGERGLLQAVAERVIARHLREQGMRDVRIVGAEVAGVRSRDIHLTYSRFGQETRATVKADPYFGGDAARIADRDLIFYRDDRREYALESIGHHETREGGWTIASQADELFYYYLALDHSEGELRDMLELPDEEFFPTLRVLRDDLSVFPMTELRSWFVEHGDDYPARPVRVGDHLTWQRIVPRGDLDAELDGRVHVGSIYRA